MRIRTSLLNLAALAIAFTITACGSAPATLNDVPAYPGATELKPGESTIASTLQKNGQQDAAIRQAMNVGGSVAQKAFGLPKDAQWDAVNTFYADKLKAAGWTSGLGGVASQFVDINKVTAAATQGNNMFQTVIYTKGKQSLTLVYLVDPTNMDRRQLICSLASN